MAKIYDYDFSELEEGCEIIFTETKYCNSEDVDVRHKGTILKIVNEYIEVAYYFDAYQDETVYRWFKNWEITIYDYE